MKKFIVAFAWICITSLANAVPNVWTDTLRQGWYAARISSENNEYLILGCLLQDENDVTNHHVSVNYKDKEIVNSNIAQPISFYIDDTHSYAPDPITRTSTNSTYWGYFIEDIKKAKKIEVYNNNKLLFILKPRNSKAIDFLEVCG